jgi:hypothetical protein
MVMLSGQQQTAAMSKCTRCGGPVEWRDTPNGKRAPYNPDGRIHPMTCGNQPQVQAQAQPQLESSDRSREIRRQVAIKTAAELVAAFKPVLPDEVKTGDIFPLADKILAWLEAGNA